MLKAFKAKALKDNTFTCKLANSPGPETPTTPANPEDSLLQIAARDLCSPEINEALAPAAAAAQDEPGDDLLLQGDDQPPALLPAALRWRIKHKSKEATTSTADRDKDPDGDRWPGNIPWNTLYPGNGSSARPNRLGNATMTARPPVVPDDPAETGAPPSHDHLDDTSESSETESEQEDYVPEYNPFLVKIINDINEGNRLKRAAREEQPSHAPPVGDPAASPTGTPSPAAFLGSAAVHPAIKTVLKRLKHLQDYGPLYCKQVKKGKRDTEWALKEEFGPGVPIWRIVDDLIIQRSVSADHRQYLLGPDPDPKAQRQHLMDFLEPLIGQYVVQQQLAATPGTPRHRFAAYKLLIPTLSVPEAARFNSPQAEFFDMCSSQCNEANYGEEVGSYGTGRSWMDLPHLTVYTYQVLEEPFEKLLGSIPSKTKKVAVRRSAAPAGTPAAATQQRKRRREDKAAGDHTNPQLQTRYQQFDPEGPMVPRQTRSSIPRCHPTPSALQKLIAVVSEQQHPSLQPAQQSAAPEPSDLAAAAPTAHHQNPVTTSRPSAPRKSTSLVASTAMAAGISHHLVNHPMLPTRTTFQKTNKLPSNLQMVPPDTQQQHMISGPQQGTTRGDPATAEHAAASPTITPAPQLQQCEAAPDGTSALGNNHNRVQVATSPTALQNPIPDDNPHQAVPADGAASRAPVGMDGAAQHSQPLLNQALAQPTLANRQAIPNPTAAGNLPLLRTVPAVPGAVVGQQHWQLVQTADNRVMAVPWAVAQLAMMHQQQQLMLLQAAAHTSAARTGTQTSAVGVVATSDPAAQLALYQQLQQQQLLRHLQAANQVSAAHGAAGSGPGAASSAGATAVTPSGVIGALLKERTQPPAAQAPGAMTATAAGTNRPKVSQACNTQQQFNTPQHTGTLAPTPNQLPVAGHQTGQHSAGAKRPQALFDSLIEYTAAPGATAQHTGGLNRHQTKPVHKGPVPKFDMPLLQHIQSSAAAQQRLTNPDKELGMGTGMQRTANSAAHSPAGAAPKHSIVPGAGLSTEALLAQQMSSGQQHASQQHAPGIPLSALVTAGNDPGNTGFLPAVPATQQGGQLPVAGPTAALSPSQKRSADVGAATGYAGDGTAAPGPTTAAVIMPDAKTAAKPELQRQAAHDSGPSWLGHSPMDNRQDPQTVDHIVIQGEPTYTAAAASSISMQLADTSAAKADLEAHHTAQEGVRGPTAEAGARKMQLQQPVHEAVPPYKPSWPAKGRQLPAAHWVYGVQNLYRFADSSSSSGSLPGHSCSAANVTSEVDNKVPTRTCKDCLRQLKKQGVLLLLDKQLQHSGAGKVYTNRTAILQQAQQLKRTNTAAYQQQLEVIRKAPRVTYEALLTATENWCPQQTASEDTVMMFNVEVDCPVASNQAVVDYMLDVLVLGYFMWLLIGLGGPDEPDWAAAGLACVTPCAPPSADTCSSSISTLLHEDLLKAICQV